MTHAELVAAAASWLAGSRRCEPVLTEQAHFACCEVPDAIGWFPGGCVVVECKVSREDCRADRAKIHARNGESMGDERWILAPKGVLSPDDIPYGHGLAEVRGSRVFVVVPAPARDVTWKRLRAECEFMRVEMSQRWQQIRQTQRGHRPADEEGQQEGENGA